MSLAVDEVVIVTVDATGGTFALGFDGNYYERARVRAVTAPIAYDASAAAVTSALEALPNIAPGDVAVTGDAGGPWTVTFGGDLGEQDLSTLYIATNALTGASQTASVEVDTAGSNGRRIVSIRALNRSANIRVVDQDGNKVKVTPTEEAVIDLDNAENRRSLASHSAIGQWIVVQADDPYGRYR